MNKLGIARRLYALIDWCLGIKTFKLEGPEVIEAVESGKYELTHLDLTVNNPSDEVSSLLGLDASIRELVIQTIECNSVRNIIQLTLEDRDEPDIIVVIGCTSSVVKEMKELLDRMETLSFDAVIEKEQHGRGNNQE